MYTNQQKIKIEKECLLLFFATVLVPIFRMYRFQFKKLFKNGINILQFEFGEGTKL